MVLKFKWFRDPEVSHPHTWATFHAKDVKNEKLVKYCVQDLTADRFDEAFELMAKDYLKNEPLDDIFGDGNDEESIRVFKSICNVSMDQKMILVCIDTSTEKIVGANILWVISKEDNYAQQFADLPVTTQLKTLFQSIEVLYKNFDVFEAYRVDKYIGSIGLSVAKEYIGRGIGREILLARKLIGSRWNIKVTHTIFSSDYSNRIAQQIGFKIDNAITYKQLAQLDPRFAILENITHEKLTICTWVF